MERKSEREREREGGRERERERCEDGGRRVIYADAAKLLVMNKRLDYVFVCVFMSGIILRTVGWILIFLFAQIKGERERDGIRERVRESERER